MHAPVVGHGPSDSKTSSARAVFHRSERDLSGCHRSSSGEEVGVGVESDDRNEPTGPLGRRLQYGSGYLETGQIPAPAHAPAHAPAPANQPTRTPGAQHDLRMATFTLLDGTVLARFQCHVDAGTLIIGRGSSAAVRVSDAFVHRQHASVVWDASIQAHVLRHLGGTNGTWMNLARVSDTAAVRLAHGARVRVGRTELIYHRVH